MSKQTIPEYPRVIVDCGAIEGFRLSVQGKNDLAIFWGIPYAKPPVGERRWRAPEAPDSWSGIRQAKSFSPACAQFIGGEDFFRRTILDAFDMKAPEPLPIKYSEDCLYLNIYSESLDTQTRHPVMVWIHGGAFMYGTGADYDPQHLARKGVVVVTINYRLHLRLDIDISMLG